MKFRITVLIITILILALHADLEKRGPLKIYGIKLVYALLGLSLSLSQLLELVLVE
jgi:hypothetical protein